MKRLSDTTYRIQNLYMAIENVKSVAGYTLTGLAKPCNNGVIQDDNQQLVTYSAIENCSSYQVLEGTRDLLDM